MWLPKLAFILPTFSPLSSHSTQCRSTKSRRKLQTTSWISSRIVGLHSIHVSVFLGVLLKQADFTSFAISISTGRGKSLGVQGRLAKLRRLIQCPQTAKYIRRLSIWSFPSPDKSRNAAAFILIPFDILEVMLTQLPSLQFLELKYVHITSNTDEFAYCPIPPPCSFHPSRTLQTLEMEGVALDNLDTMLTSLLSLAQPSKLNLSAVFPAKHQDVVKYPPPVLTNPAITTSLRLTCVSDECLQALISSAPNLKTLIIEGPHGPEKSLKLVGELLQQLSSLEELELSEYMFRGSVQWSDLPLEALQLKAVTIRLILDNNPLDFCKTWQAVALFLHRIPRTVTRIKFIAELSDVPESLPRPLLPPSVLNPCFDRFPALHTVAFGWTLFHYPPREQRTEQLMNLVRQLFPDLQRRGVLQYVP
ncbi:hypothetical protein QCA50_010766 [Cerrena zonata]|uniref:Uncharacterized protein n=1 Tax=Cerrena zonata TaxID=2478898 RepID=A0AAW0FYD4_9APHY